MDRHTRPQKPLAGAAVTAAAAVLLTGFTAQAPDGSALLTQIDRSLNPPSYDAYKQIVNIEPDGRRREYLLYTINDGQDKVAAVFLNPASDRGRSTLRLGENMWLYVPNAGKPLRITSLQSVVGGVFNNADILRIDYHLEYDVTNLDDAGAERILELKAKTPSVAYDRLKMWVARASALPSRIECLTSAGMLIKTLHFKDVKDFGRGIVRPAVVETDSPLYKGFKSVMVFHRIEPRAFKAEVFTLAFMPSLESLRR
jgi:outer membrane lipoprotein-sorting protein